MHLKAAYEYIHIIVVVCIPNKSEVIVIHCFICVEYKKTSMLCVLVYSYILLASFVVDMSRSVFCVILRKITLTLMLNSAAMSKFTNITSHTYCKIKITFK